MWFLVFFLTICAYYYWAKKTQKDLIPKYEKAKEEYLESIKKELKKYAISKDVQNIDFLNTSSSINGIYIKAFFIFLVIGAVFYFWGYNLATDKRYGQDSGAFVLHLILGGFGITSAYFYATYGIKGKVFKKMESFRCPHCNAPLSYFLIKTYKDNEQHYLKRVKKTERTNGHTYSYTDDVPMTKCTIHEVYKCSRCKKIDENSYNLESETGSFIDNVSNAIGN